MTAARTVELDHLLRLTGPYGLFEHAEGTSPRPEHGYCVDDSARLLLVCSREPEGEASAQLTRTALELTLAAVDQAGRVRNRRAATGEWTDPPSTDDCWGRAVWGLGAAAAHHPDRDVRTAARGGFDRAVQRSSPWPHAMAFAALGAAEVLTVVPEHADARRLLARAVSSIGGPATPDWPWPEARLTYANAALAEALLAAGAALDNRRPIHDGLTMLTWLLETETSGSHLSVTPHGGRGPRDVGPQFDQQPIEVAALADACWRARAVTGDGRWTAGIEMAAAWFDGDNDTGEPMWDRESGGAYDGLQRVGVNRNQGAESTLALVSTRQRAGRAVAGTVTGSARGTPLPVADSGIWLRPDPDRTILRLFVAGHEDVGPGDSRAGLVIRRVLDLDDADVASVLADLEDRFTDRHRDLRATFEGHAALVGHPAGLDPTLPEARRLLLGASFTHEFAVEGAALCNPSIVPHPVQPGGGALAFVLSVRGIGEGHRSSIGFREGLVTAAGAVVVHPPGPFAHTGDAAPGVMHREVLHRKLAEVGDDHQNASFVLDALPPSFDAAELRLRLAALADHSATRRNTESTVAHLEELCTRSYRVDFPATGALSERILWPQSPAEHVGLEDARFLRFADDGTAGADGGDGGTPTYYATYTAFDGRAPAQHLITTHDFVSFDVGPMAGRAATGKGLALFPRRIDGQYVALSRFDREANWIARSDDIRCWDTAEPLQVPEQSWEILQLGNCGPPMEIDAGWLVLTHGVGPMRTYAIGALLLDRDDPSIVLAATHEPILRPGRDDAGGYVPNVVYSCGALVHAGRLVLPYGLGDQSIRIATIPLDAVLDRMRPREPSTRGSRATGPSPS